VRNPAAATRRGIVSNSGEPGPPWALWVWGWTGKPGYPPSRGRRYTLLARWVWGVRDTPVTATRLLARNAAAAWLMLCMAPPLCFLSVVVFGVDRQVQREDAGQNQHVVLAGSDVDRIARGRGQPALGDGRDGLAVRLDREFVAEQVTVDLHVADAVDADSEPFAEGGEQVLAHLGGVLPVEGELVGGAERGQLAVHLPGLAARRVAEDEPVMQAQHLAVHVQHRLPGLVGDVGVLTQAEQALPDHVHLQLPPPALALSRCPPPPSPPSPGRLHRRLVSRQPGCALAPGQP